MIRPFTMIAAAPAVAALAVGTLMLATAPANASYLGYGNGDPGNWSLWDEQNGGPEGFKAIQERDREWVMAHHSSKYPERYPYSNRTAYRARAHDYAQERAYIAQ